MGSQKSPPTLLQIFIAEVFGTWALTLFGPASVITLISMLGGGPAALFGIGAAFGFIVMVMIYTLGHISGTHINPSVTVALAAIGRIPVKLVGPYIVAQIIGSIIAGLCLYGFYPVKGKDVHFGSTLPGAGVGDGAALVIEIILTMWLLFVIMGVAVDKRAPTGWAGFSIGMVVACDIWMGGPLTGASMNFARSLGPAVAAAIAGDMLPLSKVWIYLVGPVIGGIIGAALYEYIFKPSK
ncbi:MAG: aquaporin [Ignisphaera sp.]|nr:aquaporin [Ignisphaera sp.]MCX8168272.1 aquaporin [Ignisphaera sp.]MDW8086045.1 aquaporin [Ignisphaera sp.]